MNLHALIILVSIIPGLHAVQLRNGQHASQTRVEQIWQAVQQTKHYPLLLCTALDCNTGKLSNHIEAWNITADILAEWHVLKIVNNQYFDLETQNIIITTYFGSDKPEWGIEAPKKIALAYPRLYPVASWTDYVPGLSFFKNMSGKYHASPRVVASS